MRSILFAALAVLLATLGTAHAAVNPNRPVPGFVRVRLDTSAGPIVLALDARHAPRTTANFLAYVDDGRFDGTLFYRAARRKGDPKLGFVQGGIGQDAQRILPSIPLEPTSRTGIHHLDGTVSMAHGVDPNSGAGNFSIMVGANPSLDARGSYLGFAAFGHVVAGMQIVRQMLVLPTGGGSDAMKDQMILRPIRIIRAERLDGIPRPTGRPKPWLLGIPH